MKTIVNLFNDETGGYEPVELPARYEVCPTCEGRGRVDNLGPMTGDEYREACHDCEDFAANYRNGLYDVTCHECKGLRVVTVVDEDRLDKATIARLHQHYDDLAADEAERRAERRYGY